MALFNSKSFSNHDDYVTPFSAWDDIKDFIPKDKVLWESFYCNGESGNHLVKLGLNVIHENIDFFENNMGDVVISNPPFSKIPLILTRLKEMEKPFILLMPSSKLNTQYFRKLFHDIKDPIQIIVPKKRIQFEKVLNGVTLSDTKSSCNFDCFYYCWKIGLASEIVWLKN